MRILGVALIVSFHFVVSVASATTVSVFRDPNAHGSSVSWNGGSEAGTGSGTGGLFLWNITGSTPSGISNDDYFTLPVTKNGSTVQKVVSFCIDLRQTVGSSYQIEPDISKAPRPWIAGSASYPMGDTKAHSIRVLWAEHFGDVVSHFGQNDARKYGDAFQFAIWEIIYEDFNTNGWAVDAGAFKLTSGATTDTKALAKAWLDDVMNGYTGTLPTLEAWVSPADGTSTPAYQDQIVQHAPEPSSVVQLAGLLLAAIAVRAGWGRWRGHSSQQAIQA